MSDPPLPASFGDVTGEYLALRRGAGLIAAWHELVWIRGDDAIEFLDGLLTQSVGAMAPGSVAPSLLLSPQGKLRATSWLLRGDDEVGIVADRGAGDVVEADLARFRIRVDVTIGKDPLPVTDVWGPEATEVLSAAGLPVPGPDGWVSAPTVAAVDFAKVDLPRFVVVGDHFEELVAAGAVPSGSLAADAVRIESGEVTTGVEVDDKTIPQEALLVEDAVDFSKGCYLGQELVARIDSRGRVNRTLRGLVLRDNVLPPVPAEVRSADRDLGLMSSVAESLELRAPVGLGLLRREAEPGEEVEIVWEGGTVRARIAELPLV